METQKKGLIRCRGCESECLWMW